MSSPDTPREEPTREAVEAVEHLTAPTDDFYRSFDACVWAKAWLKTIAEHPEIPTDEGTMIGWFANALMRGYDEHAWRNPLPPSDAPSGWDTDVRLVLSEVATWITLAHHRDRCRQRYGESCTCGRDAILAKLRFDAAPLHSGEPTREAVAKPYALYVVLSPDGDFERFVDVEYADGTSHACPREAHPTEAGMERIGPLYAHPLPSDAPGRKLLYVGMVAEFEAEDNGQKHRELYPHDLTDLRVGDTGYKVLGDGRPFRVVDKYNVFRAACGSSGLAHSGAAESKDTLPTAPSLEWKRTPTTPSTRRLPMYKVDRAIGRPAVPPTPTRCPTCNHPQLAGVPCAVCGINEAVAPLLTPPQPTSVAEARDHLAKWPQSMNRDEFLADVEVLLTAARADARSSMLREVREMVEGMQKPDQPLTEGKRNETLRDVLAGLTKMEGKA